MQLRKRVIVPVAALLAVLLAASPQAVPALAQSGSPQTAPDTKPAAPVEARIDINRASAGELLKVPGMTASWAGRIVRFRPYRSKQDLLDRGVLPSDVYGRIKDYIVAHRDER